MRMLFLSWFWASALFGQEYRLGPGDVLQIQVLDLQEMNGDYQVDSRGYIAMPYLDQVLVAGMDVKELQALIEGKLKESYLNNPQVIVRLREYKSRPISVIGAVNKPGQIQDQLQIDLLGALTQAGGVQQNAGNRIFILRRGDSGRSATLEIDLNQLLYEGKAYLNIPLMPGDTVNIPADLPLSVFITGEVVRPGEYQFSRKNRVTLLQVISKAGGLTDYAKDRKISIKRESDGGLREHTVDLRAVRAGRIQDFEIFPNDIILVP